MPEIFSTASIRRFLRTAGIGALACAGPLLVAIGDTPKHAPIDTHVSQSSPQRTFGVAVGDVNGDDRLDALFAHGISAGGFPNEVCHNRGEDPFFSRCEALSADERLTGEVELGDADNDGDLDAVVANNGKTSRGAPNQVCFNDDGFPSQASCPDITEQKASLDVALGDLDDDGFVDAVFANSDEGAFAGGGARNTVCFNQNGEDQDCRPLGAEKVSTIGVALGDVTGNGRLDVVFANRKAPNTVCRNVTDGLPVGDEPCTPISPEETASRGVALGDVDDDGDLDAVFANGDPDWRNTVCTNDDGLARDEPCIPVGSNEQESFRVALADVDGDGDLDAVFANGGLGPRPNTVCRNSDGAFDPDQRCESITTDPRDSRDVAMGDVDADGDPDAIFANGGALRFEPERLCLNDGGLVGVACQDIGTEASD